MYNVNLKLVSSEIGDSVPVWAITVTIKSYEYVDTRVRSSYYPNVKVLVLPLNSKKSSARLSDTE